MANRSCGAASPELDHSVPRHVRHPSTEGLGKAVPVSVVANPLAVFEQDRVDGSEGLGCLRKLGQERNDGLLAGMGDVEPIEAKIFCCREDLWQVLHPSPNLLQVNQTV